MASDRIMREISHITSLGLGNKDLRVIKDVIAISKKLKDNFVYNAKLDLMAADIVFINAESELSMKFYAKHGEAMQAEPIFVYAGNSEDGNAGVNLSKYPNAKTLKTPVKLVDLSSVLLGIVSTPMLKAKTRKALSKKANCFRMLVVDDSFPVRKYLEEKLPELMSEMNPNLHFDIQYASSGREAVNKVKAARGAYDIIFLDIMMEDIDGYKICKWIKKVKSSIDVVMLTSKSSPIDRVRANMSGCDSFLSKPPKDAHLKKVIMKHRRLVSVPMHNVN